MTKRRLRNRNQSASAKRRRSLGLHLERLEERQLLALTAQMLADLNIQTAVASFNVNGELETVGGVTYFAAADEQHGTELWKSNGTAAGTTLVREICKIPFYAGSDPSELTNVNGTLYFTAYDGDYGRDLWKSDGTSAGTVMVRQFNQYGVQKLTNVNGTLFFSTLSELWKSNGTSTGTVRIANNSPNELTNVNGTLFFTSYGSSHGLELWKSNGTSAGTVLVRDIRAGSNSSAPTNLTNVNGTLYFRADDGSRGIELWKSNGTSAGTSLVRDIRTGVNSSFALNLTNVNGTLFFTAFDGTSGRELWKSNGTAAGTALIRDIRPGSSNAYPGSLVNVNGTLYFTALQDASGYELWKSNGTSAGTTLVRDLAPGNKSSFTKYGGNLTNVNGALFFAANDGTRGNELWKSDGTSVGTMLLGDLAAGATSSNPINLSNSNGRLLLTANAGNLWTSNGASAGTVQIKPLISSPQTNSTSTAFVQVGGFTYFVADDGLHGFELWRSNGTSAGTVLVRDIFPGPTGSRISELTNVNGTLFFAAYDTVHGVELWKSNGSSAGTSLVRDIKPGVNSSSPTNLTNVSGRLFFSAEDDADFKGTELWGSNGSSTGTVMVADCHPGIDFDTNQYNPFPYSSAPDELTNVNGTLFFTADGRDGRELWKSNGTSAGTVMVRDIYLGGDFLIHFYPSSSNPGNLTNVNGVLYFTAEDGDYDQSDPGTGRELWKSDGTSAGTVQVRDIRPGRNAASPLSLSNVNGTLFFTAFDGTSGRELWKSNGTSDGTVLVRDLRPGSNSAFPGSLTNVNGTLYFTAFDEAAGFELWKTNGTSAGTTLVRDILPGTAGSNAQYGGSLTNVGGKLFFVANNGTHGSELWQSNGTSLGTTLVRDIRVGGAGSSPTILTNAGGKLFFTANDGSHGAEPWLVTLPNTAPVLNATKSPAFNYNVEDADVPVGAVGTLVSQLVNITGSLGNVVDPDYGALSGMAITSADTTNGTWYYSTNNGTTWLALGAVANASARLLAADGSTRIYFKPKLGYSGLIVNAITFRAWDRTGGMNGGVATTIVNGGTTTFSSATDTASIAVL